jgi:drug/metabolite transporter (DMT)-like permease
MLFYAFYLLYARKNKTIPSIYLYVVPVYIIAGLICLTVALVVDLAGSPILWIGPDKEKEWIAILGLALIPTVLGHSIINWALKTIRGQTVVIINLSQFIFAGIMGFFILMELPALSFYFTCFLIIGGALVVILNSSKSEAK